MSKLFGGGDSSKPEPYEEMKDTPWITQGRDIADRGGKGILENYNKVNVFDDATRKSLEARNNATYQRAFGDMERQYTDIMNKYNAANYNQFGTLNATPAAYRTDMANLAAQRQMDDLAYNKAINYDKLINNELQRRYNTMDMYNTMYGYGAVPYQQDVANWNVRNTNKDLDYYGRVQNNAGGNNMLSGIIPAITMFGSNLGNFGSLFGSSNNTSSSPISSAINNSVSGSGSSGNALYDAILNSTGGFSNYTL